MVWNQIFRACAIYLYIFSAILLAPLAIAFSYEFILPKSMHSQPFETLAFFETLCVSFILALFFQFLGKKASKTLYRKEAIALVVIIWVLTPALAALPFVFNKTLDRFEDAYFEMCSGFTTTGVSVLITKKYDKETGREITYESNLGCLGKKEAVYHYFGTVKPVTDSVTHEIYTGIEAIGKGLLFWRSLSQWLGGIGIVLLFVAILPTLEASAKVLYHSETVGPLKETLTPRIQDSAAWLFKIYLGMSALLLFGLLLSDANLPFFDALTLTFSTVSSGGFTIHNNNMESYTNVNTQWLITLFMVLGTINFSLFYYFLRKKFYRLKNSELGIYLLVLIVFSALVSFLLRNEMPLNDAIRLGTFQIVSSISTTGFTIANYDYWPYAIQVLMLVSMFIGGMSGSTSGSIKIIRHYLLNRIALQKIKAVSSPDTVLALNVGGTKITETMASRVLCFFFLFITIAVIGTIIFIFDGVDPETALGVAASTLNNTGYAFRVAGPTESFAFLSPFSKYFACFLMLLGRLELFIILLLFLPAFWKKR